MPYCCFWLPPMVKITVFELNMVDSPRSHHHQNAWAAEARSTYLVRRKWPYPTARSHSWQIEAGAITNLKQPGLTWMSGWSSPAQRTVYSKHLFPSDSVSLRCRVSHTGSSSPVISILYVHWCEVQADEVLWDGVYPYTSASRIRLMQSSSSRCCTFPYHLSLDPCILSVMQQTPTAWRMSSFLFLSFSVIPSIH